MTKTTDGLPEPYFARAVAKALGGARTVLDATTDGLGAYAPTAREVTMTTAPDGSLPFADGSFDAAMAAFSLPGWDDPERGIAELRRVSRGTIVLLAVDPERLEQSWLVEYAPEVVAAEAARHPSLHRIVTALGSDHVTCTTLPIPFTCVGGFSEAYYGRPERLLDPGVRRADPAWDLVDEMTVRRSVSALRTAVESGQWDRRWGALRVRPSHDGSIVLITATRPA